VFLESLKLPAAFVNRDLTVLTGKRALRSALTKFHHGEVGLRIGEVLKCGHLEKHGECGEKAVCPYCGIRKLVELARISGENFEDIPLRLRNKSGEEPTGKSTSVGEPSRLIRPLNFALAGRSRWE